MKRFYTPRFFLYNSVVYIRTYGNTFTLANVSHLNEELEITKSLSNRRLAAAVAVSVMLCYCRCVRARLFLCVFGCECLCANEENENNVELLLRTTFEKMSNLTMPMGECVHVLIGIGLHGDLIGHAMVQAHAK